MQMIQTFLLKQRQRSRFWLKTWLLFLAGLLALNVFLRPEEAHFVLDSRLGFWAVFGLGVGYLMIFIMKRLIQPLLFRREDYYGDI